MKPGVLLVANWKSDVGYAWWLMESYWRVISETLSDKYTIYLAFPELNEVPETLKNGKIKFVEFPFYNVSQDLSGSVSFIKQHNIEVLYFTDFRYASPLYLRFRMAGVKHIINHDHTPGHRTTPTGLKRWLKKLYFNLPLLRADKIFAVTPFVKQRAQNTVQLNADYCAVIPNGIYPLKGSQQAPAERDDVAALKLVSVSRVSEYKNLSFIVAVIKRCVERGLTNIHWTHYGDGPYMNGLQQEVTKAGLQNHVTLAGKVPSVDKLLGQYDIGFQSSRGEVGYSLSILEMMRAGLPVLAPDNPSVCGATAHGKTGYIYREDDVNDAVEGVAQYYQQPPQIQAHGAAAIDVFGEKYNLHNTHDVLRKEIKKVIA
ncbi:glycosyltransferase family 4 protein [Salinimonas lutimaris]|uniref:glycosyltransferase family 4 protein n=1 Tax=Salinimonas lutimaris TaxID=914153 RepID=UPI0010BFE8D8|nr:glycosyltransferase family 4 protein [Salinimonas lutimaris]